MVTGRKLLLADDSVTIQKVVDLTFTDEGLEVITASDGQEALDHLQSTLPDIVLADVHMPQLSGYELCELIKLDERFRHIPVMLLVGAFEPFDEAEARRVGADDHLTKPFQSIRTLIGKVQHLLSGEKTGLDEATTRKLTAPPESRPATADPEFLERSTADTVPLPDLHDDAEAEAVPHEVSFSDLSLDDELIETSPISEYSAGTPSFEQKATAQYSTADLHEAGIAHMIERPLEYEEAVSSYAPSRGADLQPAAYRPQYAVPSSELASSDDALLDLGDFESSGAMREADDFFLDVLDDVPSHSTPVASLESVESRESSESVELTQSVAPAVEWQAGEASYPAPETYSAPETQSQYELPTTERFSDDYSLESVAPSAEPSATDLGGLIDSAPPRGQITLDQLSPEVIDAIARRAVEHLSERAVEQIAWEVVPDLAERMIKRRLEEEKT